MKRFSYAPWGNRDEENATIERIRIGSGSFYSKFAYYGESPLELEEYESFGQRNTNNAGLKISYPFDASLAKREEILLIKLEKGEVKQVIPINFSPLKIPMGSVLFQSYATEAVYISINEEKFRLDSGKHRLFKVDPRIGNQHAMVLGYLMRNGKYKTAFKRMIRDLGTQRGIIMLRTQGTFIKSMNLFESSKKSTGIIGLGSVPLIMPPLAVGDENGSVDSLRPTQPVLLPDF